MSLREIEEANGVIVNKEMDLIKFIQESHSWNILHVHVLYLKLI